MARNDFENVFVVVTATDEADAPATHAYGGIYLVTWPDATGTVRVAGSRLPKWAAKRLDTAIDEANPLTSFDAPEGRAVALYAPRDTTDAWRTGIVR